MIALDTNIIVYAASPTDLHGRHVAARTLIRRLTPVGAILPVQVIGEFLNACWRKKITSLASALKRSEEFLGSFDCPVTTPDDVLEAAGIMASQKLAYFDALIITVAARAGATILLSEDMHDGFKVGGLNIINPFAPANEALLTDYFDSFT